MGVELLVRESELSRISFDYALTLLTVDGAEFKIETSFALRRPAQSALTLDPENLVTAASELVSLLRREIASATAADDGSLLLRFGDGTELSVAPADQFEAWTFAGSSGEKAVSSPGGGLVTFGLK